MISTHQNLHSSWRRTLIIVPFKPDSSRLMNKISLVVLVLYSIMQEVISNRWLSLPSLSAGSVYRNDAICFCRGVRGSCPHGCYCISLSTVSWCMIHSWEFSTPSHRAQSVLSRAPISGSGTSRSPASRDSLSNMFFSFRPFVGSWEDIDRLFFLVVLTCFNALLTAGNIRMFNPSCITPSWVFYIIFFKD